MVADQNTPGETRPMRPDAAEPAAAIRAPRRHDLDALRAVAMLLGIVLHGALSYIDVPWVVRDASRSTILGHAVAAVHGFRMPLFFLLSGFFTAMLWQRRGVAGLLKHRALRIAVPLMLGLVTIVPLVWITIGWAILTMPGMTEADASRDLWSASAVGDAAAVQDHLADGADPGAVDPTFGVTPLGFAAITGHPDVVRILLDAGADPAGRYDDGNTPLHTAAFFGRAALAELLIDAGAPFDASNRNGETPEDLLRMDERTTAFIAGLLQVEIEFATVQAGRDRIASRLEEERATREADPGAVAATVSSGDEASPSIVGQIVGVLMVFPFFHHLWFLWFLCWLIGGFVVIVEIARRLPIAVVPRLLVAFPLCLIWLVPLTMLTQSMMDEAGVPTFGPDTSAGLIPMPHVLAHYAIFFGFGALVYGSPGAVDGLGRSWWIQLPLSLLILPVALALVLSWPQAESMIADDGTRRLLGTLTQVIFAWLVIFGLIGLFRAVLDAERPGVRYLSDASYWMYLVSLPILIGGQILLRDAAWPVWMKLTVLLLISTAIMLASYALLVRWSWIGWLLNGRRVRRHPVAAAPAPPPAPAPVPPEEAERP